MYSHSQWDYIFTWKITEFSEYYPNHLYSPDFNVAALGDYKWCLLLCPKSQNNYYLSCYLVKRKNNESDKEIKFSFEIVMFLDGRCIRKKQAKNVPFKNEDGIGFPEFCRRDDLAAGMKENIIHNLTLLCYIKRKPIVYGEPEITEALTRIVKHKSVVPWKVKFSEGNLQTHEEIKFSLDGSIFKIHLSVLQEEFNIVISSIFLKDNSNSIPIIGKAILYVDGRELSVIEETHILFGNGVYGWNFQSLISNQQLRDNASDYVKDGEILLIFSFSSFLETVSTAVTDLVENIPAEKIMYHHSHFFHNLFRHEKSKDVILRIDRSNEQFVHKSVLVSRSPVFFAMFNHDTIENETGIVNLVDVDAETLEYFLNFLYTDVFPTSVMNCEKATELLILADYYIVRKLIQACVKFLIAVLSTDNVLDVLALADTIYQKRLKKACIHYAAHHYTDIFSSKWPKWAFQNFKLHAKIYECLVSENLQN